MQYGGSEEWAGEIWAHCKKGDGFSLNPINFNCLINSCAGSLRETTCKKSRISILFLRHQFAYEVRGLAMNRIIFTLGLVGPLFSVVAAGAIFDSSLICLNLFGPNQKVQLTAAEFTTRYRTEEISGRHQLTGILPGQFVDIRLKSGETSKGRFVGSKGDTLLVSDFSYLLSFGESNAYAEIDLRNITDIKVMSGFDINAYSRNGIFGIQPGDRIRLVETWYEHGHFTFEKVEGIAVLETSEYIELKVARVRAVDRDGLYGREYSPWEFSRKRKAGRTVKILRNSYTQEAPDVTQIERTVNLKLIRERPLNFNFKKVQALNLNGNLNPQ